MRTSQLGDGGSAPMVSSPHPLGNELSIQNRNAVQTPRIVVVRQGDLRYLLRLYSERRIRGLAKARGGKRDLEVFAIVQEAHRRLCQFPETIRQPGCEMLAG